MKFVDGWVDTASEYNIMQNSMSREGYVPTHLVIHGTAGGTYAKDVAAYEAANQVSTHFIIGVDGEVGQEVSVQVAAWGNAPLNAPRLNFDNADANPNYWTISIEFCKPDTTNQIDITDAQFAAGAPLIALICDTYNIPKRAGDGHSGVISHADINSVDRAMCPGTFRWDALWAYLNTNQETNMGLQLTDPMGTYFTSTAADTWTCKQNNIQVHGAILVYYLMTNGIVRLPVTSEQTNIAGVVWQQFESGILVYDPSNKLDNPPSQHNHTYLIKLDSDLARQITGYNDEVNKLITLQTAYNKIVDEKNGLIAQLANLTAQLAQSSNTALLTQQIAALQVRLKQISPLASQISSLSVFTN